jgi:NADPH-dependent 2,4-dienoyl-CoA reductase/sulfur reductase-like enzyme
LGPIVIVGASLAGLRAAQAIRSSGHDGQLVVIGDEQHMPYTRPPLSKELLAGDHTVEKCAFDCSAVDALWRLGETATGLDLAARRVLLDSGDWVPFERVIVATGCRARTWTGPGADLDGLFTLRDIDDSLALSAALDAAQKVVVVGAGFVGCEVAATARKRGADVTIVDIAEHPMVPLGPLVGERCRALHEGNGVELIFGTSVNGFTGDDNGRVRAVELANGTSLDADLVVVALGAIPNTEWLTTSNLPTDRGGVLCDSTLTADGDSDVLCAGDVTTWPHHLAGGDTVRIEHWTNAVEQGTLAGRNSLLPHAERKGHDSVPYFWTDQYDVKIQAVGFPARADSVELIEEDDGKFAAVGTKDGELISAVTWNAPRTLMTYRRELAGRPAAVTR